MIQNPDGSFSTVCRPSSRVTSKALAICKSCKADIIWAINESSMRWMPLDAVPVQTGNIEIVGTTVERGAKQPLARVVDFSSTAAPRYVAHHATCPDAASYRRRGTK
jgi:hypothetical protein